MIRSCIKMWIARTYLITLIWGIRLPALLVLYFVSSCILNVNLTFKQMCLATLHWDQEPMTLISGVLTIWVFQLNTLNTVFKVELLFCSWAVEGSRGAVWKILSVTRKIVFLSQIIFTKLSLWKESKGFYFKRCL